MFSLREILNSEAFKECVEEVRSELAGTVLSSSTEDDDRAEALRQYHLLDHLVIKMTAKQK